MDETNVYEHINLHRLIRDYDVLVTIFCLILEPKYKLCINSKQYKLFNTLGTGRILGLSPSSYSSKQMAHTSYSSPMTEIIKLIKRSLY